ncbi:Predicted metal-dependent hydrolase, TIM-barrel fold [Paramicrobacterium humi]|uniref:Predicted metal-dependent hydrolase, TIM-barrel fold n=1 Tax=Paramicrobacterium humi TaxID=640635 RepID=A0A1H4L075_9MICO|nr:amidohydrolase family protein [Microbacterium humi]SEB64113.1 Predicted metal-dependent hydrolase, TIM-barrel fold [Microbacterium humi]
MNRTAPNDVRLKDWRPRSMVVVPETAVERAHTPCIDVHNHLGTWLGDGAWMAPDVAALLQVMDDCGVEAIVNLDGRWGDELEANLERYDRAHPERFVTFCHLDWRVLAEDGGERALRESLEDSARRGARGLKVWKDLGLGIRDATGALIAPDDERVIRLLGHAADLGMPILMHTGDPRAFFEPLDERNERLDELGERPDWWFGDRTRYPSFDELLAAHARVVLALPHARIIGAHVGNCAENLDTVERLLEAAPNYVIDTGGRLAELGRAPRRFAKLVERFPDRVLFGTDAFPVTREAYRLNFRFFETDDEAFSYAPEEEVPPQGRWLVSAAGLRPELLEGFYRGNARRVLGC